MNPEAFKLKKLGPAQSPIGQIQPKVKKLTVQTANLESKFLTKAHIFLCICLLAKTAV